MPISDADIANVKAAALAGSEPMCEYVKVVWTTGVVKYYGGAAFHMEPPFNNIGFTIEPRIIYPNKNDPFHEFEVNPDIRTDAVTITFNDIPDPGSTVKPVSSLFQEYGSGVTCEVFVYFPDRLSHVSQWSGQLQAPKIYGWKTVKAEATNGYRNREQVVPCRDKLKECSAHVFGGLLPDLDAVRSNLCPYDKHLGGSVGNYKTGTTPYTDCPKDINSCIVRLGNNGLYFGGFDVHSVPPVRSGSNFIAVSKGNESALKEPVRVIFGTAHLGAADLLLWRRDGTSADGFVSTVWAICEGPVAQIWNFRINDLLVASSGGTFGNGNMHTRLGTRGQPRTHYFGNPPNFSSTALVNADYGRVDPDDYSPANLAAQCDVKGFAEVCVYTDDDPITKTRIWSDNRVWCLLELYRNQKFGLGYAETMFEIADWMTAATWSDVTVSFTETYPDGETRQLVSRRSTFNAILEGRQVSEHVVDICRSGSITVPFLHEGVYTLAPLRKATTDELEDAPVFYDAGQNVNIVGSGGQPAIELSQTPNTKIINEIEVRFEEASNNGSERPVRVNDRNQMRRAGEQLGPGRFQRVPKTYSAFGVTTYEEAVRMAYRLMWFGEFDEGGTQNNLRVTLTVPYEQALALKRYQIIKVVSEILDGFEIGDGTSVASEQAEYFRVVKIRKKSGNKAEITAQAYNHTAYTAFETDAIGTSVSSTPAVVEFAGIEEVNGAYAYAGQVSGKPWYVKGNSEIVYNAKWRLNYNGTLVYENSSNTAFPWQGAWSTTDPLVGGDAPFVAQGTPFDRPITEATIAAPTYDDATGVLTITIN